MIVATRDRAAQLRDCLACLERQSARGRFEVVVVDNGSSDETPLVLAGAPAFVRSLRVAEPNRAKARNAGIVQARGAVIIFIDDDTLPPEGFVAAHLRAHARSPRSVVSGPILNIADAARLPRPSPWHYSRAFFCTCNASAPKAELEAVAGFDERYELYGWEDTDLGVRLRRRGLRRIFAWGAYIYHHKPDQARTLVRRIALAREKGAMAARFVRKSPTLAVRLATGAHAGNFARAALVLAGPLRRLYARIASDPGSEGTALGVFAREALVDAAYLDALRSSLRTQG